MITRHGPHEEMLRRRFPSPAVRDRARLALELLVDLIRQHEDRLVDGAEIPDREPIDLEALADVLEFSITGKKPRW